VTRCLAALVLALGVASGAAAEVRRFEVVGALPIDPAAPPATPRQAALRVALQEAVQRAARDVLREATGQEPQDEVALGADAPDFAVSFRVLEDRGEQDALLSGAPSGGREYVVVAEVQVDVDRVRERLRAARRLAGEPAPAPPAAFRLEVLEIPSPAVWTAVRAALARAGAASAIPVELESGRALFEVQTALGPEKTLERLLLAELPQGLGLEPVAPEAGVLRLRVRPGPPAAPPPPSEAPPAPSESDHAPATD
jgi:hypothetical protein